MLAAEVLINLYSSDSKDVWMRGPRIPMPFNKERRLWLVFLSNTDNRGRT